MKKMTAALAALLLSLNFSCQKIYDHINPDHKTGGHQHNDRCRIAKAMSGEHTYLFYYNSNGDPDSVTTTINYQSPHSLRFAYDSQGRLTEFVTYWGMINSEVYRSYSTYSYPTDSTVYEHLKNFFAGPYEETGHLYTFDNRGRVTHETKTLEFSGAGDPPYTQEMDYIYNPQGNRIAPLETDVPPLVYDNKKNIYTTNWVWQFISKNYSKNNAQPISKYNAKRLPLVYDSPFPFLFSLSTSALQLAIDSVSYSCPPGLQD